MAMQNIDLKIVSEGKYIRQCSGHDHFGHVVLEFFFSEQAGGSLFINALEDQDFPERYIAAIKEGIKKAAEYEGMELVGARLLKAYYHEYDSSDMDFTIAAIMAFKNVKEKLRLLQPSFPFQPVQRP